MTANYKFILSGIWGLCMLSLFHTQIQFNAKQLNTSLVSTIKVCV